MHSSDSRSGSTRHAVNIIIQHKNISMFCNHKHKGRVEGIEMGTQSAVVSYTSAFASWSTGWRALQQRKENTTCYKYLHTQLPLTSILLTDKNINIHIKPHFFGKLKVHVFFMENWRIGKVKKLLLTLAIRLLIKFSLYVTQTVTHKITHHQVMDGFFFEKVGTGNLKSENQKI